MSKHYFNKNKISAIAQRKKLSVKGGISATAAARPITAFPAQNKIPAASST